MSSTLLLSIPQMTKIKKFYANVLYDWCIDGDRNPSCMRYPEETELVEIHREARDTLSQCHNSHCVLRTSKM